MAKIATVGAPEQADMNMALPDESIPPADSASADEPASPIYALLMHERPGVVVGVDNLTALPAPAFVEDVVALRDEILQHHSPDLTAVAPAGLSDAPASLQHEECKPRTLTIAPNIPIQLGRLARTELTGPSSQIEIITFPEQGDGAIKRDVITTFREMAEHQNWLRLLAMSDHPMAETMWSPNESIQLGPSITEQLDPAAQKKFQVPV